MRETLARATALAGDVASNRSKEHLARQAASGLYHAASAVILAWEAARLGEAGGDARRLLLSRMVLEHHLRPRDPLAPPDDAWEAGAISLLLGEDPVAMAEAAAMVEAG